MGDNRIIWRNSLFTRMVVIFLLIMIPFYILGMQIFRSGRDMLSKEISNSMQSQVNFYLNNLTEDLKHVRKLQFDCFGDEDLNNLANAAEMMTDYEKTKAITRLQQRLTTIKNSSVYIQNVSVLIPPINRTINAVGNNIVSIADVNTEEYNMLRATGEVPDSQIIYWNNRIFMSAILPSQYSSQSPPAFVIEVELSKSALKSALIQSDITKGVRAMLIHPTQKFAITGDIEAKTSKDLWELISRDMEEITNNPGLVTFEGEKYFVTSATSEYLGFVLSRYIPEAVVFKPLQKYQLWFWSFSMLAAVVLVFYLLSTYKFIDQVYKQKNLAQKAELKQLQSQINPHFLYNSFFILQRRISKGDYENAEFFSENLGNYFKFITRSSSDEVMLVNEVEHARIYADIQAMRFSNRIKVEFEELPAAYESLMIPRLILQPLIENAFEHGLEDKENDGLLRITFQESKNGLVIVIEDNGDRLKDSEIEELKSVLDDKKESYETTGIINIHKRIRLFLGEKSGITASRGTLGGLKVEICIESVKQAL